MGLNGTPSRYYLFNTHWRSIHVWMSRITVLEVHIRLGPQKGIGQTNPNEDACRNNERKIQAIRNSDKYLEQLYTVQVKTEES